MTSIPINQRTVGLLVSSVAVTVGFLTAGVVDSPSLDTGAWNEAAFDPNKLSVRLTTGGPSEARALEVVGWTREWLDGASRLSPETLGRILRVYPEETAVDDPTFPSVAGAVSVVDAGLRFTPRYPLPGGSRVQVVLDSHRPSADDSPHRFWARIPAAPERQAARVEAVYPSGDLLPANQLKLYLVFSEPMTTWDPYRHIQLVDEETGEPLEAVFHDMRDGLWDSLSQRLTVVFDPGRIKRGLANHERFGMPLTAGRSYRLEISGEWQDAGGRPLAAGFVKRFRVGEADRRAPAPSDWSVNNPTADSREPVVVRFHEAMDRALLEGSFQVVDEAGNTIANDLRVAAGEISCELRPHDPWRAGRYRILVDPTLEDLAGNNLLRLFDVDLLDDRPTTRSDLDALVFEVDEVPMKPERSSAR